MHAPALRQGWDLIRAEGRPAACSLSSRPEKSDHCECFFVKLSHCRHSTVIIKTKQCRLLHLNSFPTATLQPPSPFGSTPPHRGCSPPTTAVVPLVGHLHKSTDSFHIWLELFLMHAFMSVNTICELQESKGPVYWMNHSQSEPFTLTGT